LIEACSSGPYLELFARGSRLNWSCWGNQSEDYFPEWETYKNHSQNGKKGSKIVIPNGHLVKSVAELTLFEDKKRYKKPSISKETD